jgi:hypothetical protein
MRALNNDFRIRRTTKFTTRVDGDRQICQIRITVPLAHRTASLSGSAIGTWPSVIRIIAVPRHS